MSENTILVTGGAGYIGSALTGLLLNHKFNVIVVDSLKFAGESLLSFYSYPNFKFIKADIADPNAIRKIFKENRIDSVVHLAAIVGDSACKKDPKLAEQVNWKASFNLLKLSTKEGVERFIFSSTCSNYGKMSNSTDYVDETSALAPVSLYAELKVKFENFLLSGIDKKNSFSPVSLRFATAYGISPRMRFDLTVNEFTKELALKRNLEVFGEKFWRPYCHVQDISRAILAVLRADKGKIAYNVFNVGDTSENYQKQMIVDEIKKVIPQGSISYVHKQEDPRDYRVSFEKIKNELGFRVSKTIPKGIREIKHVIDNNFFIDPDSSKYRNS